MERPVEVRAAVRATVTQVRDLLRDHPGSAVAEAPSDRERADREFRTSLGASTASGSTIRQDVLISVGRPRTIEDTVRVEVEWRGAGHARLLPRFAGALVVEPAVAGSTLVLRGGYVVPLGWFGRLLDRLLGGRFASVSLEGYLTEVGHRVDAAIAAEPGDVGWIPPMQAQDPFGGSTGPGRSR